MTALPHPDGRRSLRNPDRMFLTRAEADAMRDLADLEYRSQPHASPLVGRERYRAQIEAINALEQSDGL